MDSQPCSRGVFLDLDSLHPGDLELGGLLGSLPDWDMHGRTGSDELPARLADRDLVITNKCPLDADTLATSRLKLICVAATGTNNVDLDAAHRLGIRVCNVTAYATPSVAEHTFALILSLSRRLAEHRRAARRDWPGSPHFCVLDYPIGELAGRTLGIVGYGELGRAVARLGEAFGMRILIAQRPGGRDERAGRAPLDELLQSVDVLSLHCPLTPQTRGLIDAAALGRMQPHALLINTARGGLVDEAALLEALQAQRLGGAALDVLATEPPPADHPLLTADLSNLILTPHVAWAAREARQRLVDELQANIEAFQAGGSRNQVT